MQSVTSCDSQVSILVKTLRCDIQQLCRRSLRVLLHFTYVPSRLFELKPGALISLMWCGYVCGHSNDTLVWSKTIGSTSRRSPLWFRFSVNMTWPWVNPTSWSEPHMLYYHKAQKCGVFWISGPNKETDVWISFTKWVGFMSCLFPCFTFFMQCEIK